MNQRFQFLNFTTGAGKVTVKAPANANLAPPGDYMLFVVDYERRPVGGLDDPRLDRRRRDAADRTDGADRDARRPGQVALSWGAATDAGGIARYNVHRGTTAGFTPSAAKPDRAADRDDLHRHEPRSPGTYYYRVTAEDVAGNVGAGVERGERRRHRRPPPGLVAAYGFDEGSGTTTRRPVGRRQQRHALERDLVDARGKFGKALSFNGTNAMVTVPDSNVARPDDAG